MVAVAISVGVGVLVAVAVVEGVLHGLFTRALQANDRAVPVGEGRPREGDDRGLCRPDVCVCWMLFESVVVSIFACPVRAV